MQTYLTWGKYGEPPDWGDLGALPDEPFDCPKLSPGDVLGFDPAIDKGVYDGLVVVASTIWVERAGNGMTVNQWVTITAREE